MIQKSTSDRLLDSDFGEALICANSVEIFDIKKILIDHKSKTETDFIFSAKIYDVIKTNIKIFTEYVRKRKAISISNSEHIDFLLHFADSISWCFPVEIKICNRELLDRSKALIASPLFTSLQYPWPEYGGRYKEPVFQLFLEEVSRITGIDYGAGLLQLWVGPDCYEGEAGSDYFRLIPAADVSVDQIAAIPYEISKDYFKQHEFTAGGKGIWPDYEEGSCHFEIIGFREKVVTWNERGDYIDIKKLKRVFDDELLCVLAGQIEFLVSNFRPYKGHNLMGEGWFFMFGGNSPDLWSGEILRVSEHNGKWMLHRFDSELDF